MKIPFSQQNTPSAPFDRIIYSLKVGEDVSDEDLAREIERHPGVPLPPEIHDYLIRLLRRQVKKKKGRKHTNPAALDFALFEVAPLYFEKLKQFQNDDLQERAGAKARGHKLPRGRIPPNIRAAQYVLTAKTRISIFRNISSVAFDPKRKSSISAHSIKKRYLKSPPTWRSN